MSYLMSLNSLLTDRLSAVRLALTALMGVVGGVVMVMSWWRFGSVMACVLVVGLILGFLISSIVFFTPLGKKSCIIVHAVKHVVSASIEND